MKSYSGMMEYDSFIERFRYLKLEGQVGVETFGHHRFINQLLYGSYEWEKVREFVIARDLGCDLGIEGREIYGRVIVHHIIPITEQDILERNPIVLDPENLVCVTHNTHMAIHYGSEDMLFVELNVRTPGDTTPWRS